MDAIVDKIGRVVLSRYIDTENRAIVSHGDFGEFLQAYLSHTKLWDDEPDGLSYTFMRQGLAGSVIHLSNAPRDQSFGITVHIHEPPTNVFFAGSSPESSVTGRVYTDGVKAHESSRVYVQSVRPKAEPTQSIVEVQGLDLLVYFQDYYLASEQRMARFYELDDDRFMQVISLPGAEPEFFGRMTRESAQQMLQEDGLTLLEERVFLFHCGCNPEKMMAALQDLFGKTPEELFQGDERVETHCPRCGRRWWITRDEFDARGLDQAAPTDPEGEKRTGPDEETGLEDETGEDAGKN